VRSTTESRCPRNAEVEILGVAFCGPCAHEQEAYFAIGELTQEDTEGLHSKPLTEVLERKRQERSGSTEGIAAEMPHGVSGVDEAKPLAFKKNQLPSVHSAATPSLRRGGMNSGTA
jgi:hypothetical protein